MDRITLCIFGAPRPDWGEHLHTADLPHEETGFAVFRFDDDSGLDAILAAHRPHVILSLGRPESFPRLWRSPIEVRRRWVNIADAEMDPRQITDQVMATFLANACDRRFPDEPLVSVFTPAYKSGERIRRPWDSLQKQSYRNWEWVLFDDSPDDGATFRRLCTIAETDPRVAVYRGDRFRGNIGLAKRRACGLAQGSILVELDHDDALTADALAWVVAAFRHAPEAGFAYTDWAEVFDNGEPAAYPGDWAFGFGGYRNEAYEGKTYRVAITPPVNPKTIRHIVGVPNHLRAWRRDAYFAIGGHATELHVADDYELILRSFLHTRMVHVPVFGYIQYLDPAQQSNTQRVRNGEIQRLVRYLAAHYEERIHRRFVDLGIEDFVRTAQGLDWSVPNPACADRANLVFDGADSIAGLD